MLIQEVRDTCRSEINMLHTDLHHLAAKVHSIEEEAYDTKMEISYMIDCPHKPRPSESFNATLRTSIIEADAITLESEASQRRPRTRTYKSHYKLFSIMYWVAWKIKELNWTGPIAHFAPWTRSKTTRRYLQGS